MLARRSIADIGMAPGTTRRRASRLGRPWLVGPLLFVCVLAGYLLSYNVDKPTHNADWYIRYTVACTIVEGNTFAIHPYRSDGRTGPGVGGKTYAQYTLGQTTALIPLYLLGRALAGLPHTDCAAPVAPPVALLTAKALDLVLGALLAALFYATARLLAYARRVALALAALFAFGTSLWPDALSNEEHTLESLFLLAAAYAALRYTQWKVESGKSKVGTLRRVEALATGSAAVPAALTDAGRLWLLAMGLAAGLVFVTRVAGVIAIPIFALYLVALHVWGEGRRAKGERELFVENRESTADSGSSHERIGSSRPFALRPSPFALRPLARALALYSLGVLPSILINMAYDAIRFGSPLLTNPPSKPDQSLGFPPWLGLPDLLISPGKGLIWYTPAVLLLVLAWRPFWRRAPEAMLLFIVLCAGYLLFYSDVNYWHGDPAWGPRYIYALLPYLILPLGEVFARWRTYRLPVRGLMVGVLAASFLVQFSAVTVSYWRHWHYIYGYHYDQVENHSWGQNLNYWWSPEQSPIVISLEGIADITQKYVDHAPLVQHPADQRLSNPDESCMFQLYGQASICLTDLDDLRIDGNWNTFTMWWVHVYPWWSKDTVIRLAVTLLGVFLVSGAILVAIVTLAERPTRSRQSSRSDDALREGDAPPANGYGGYGGNGQSNGNGNGHGAASLDVDALPELDTLRAPGGAMAGTEGAQGTRRGSLTAQAPSVAQVAAAPRARVKSIVGGLAPVGAAALVAALTYGGIADAAALTAPRQAPPLLHRATRATIVRDGNWTYRVLSVADVPAFPGGIDPPAFAHHYVVVRMRLGNLLTRPHHVRIENFALTDKAGLAFPDVYITNFYLRAQIGELYHAEPFGMQVPARGAVDCVLVFLVRNGAQHLKLLGPGPTLMDLS